MRELTFNHKHHLSKELFAQSSVILSEVNILAGSNPICLLRQTFIIKDCFDLRVRNSWVYNNEFTLAK